MMIEQLIDILINAIFTGVGVAVGTHLANKHVTTRLSSMEVQLKALRESINFNRRKEGDKA